MDVNPSHTGSILSLPSKGRVDPFTISSFLNTYLQEAWRPKGGLSFFHCDQRQTILSQLIAIPPLRHGSNSVNQPKNVLNYRKGKQTN